jgi:hypothetical protein
MRKSYFVMAKSQSMTCNQQTGRLGRPSEIVNQKGELWARAAVMWVRFQRGTDKKTMNELRGSLSILRACQYRFNWFVNTSDNLHNAEVISAVCPHSPARARQPNNISWTVLVLATQDFRGINHNTPTPACRPQEYDEEI